MQKARLRWVVLAGGCIMLWACSQRPEAPAPRRTVAPHPMPGASAQREAAATNRAADPKMLEQLLARKDQLPDDPKLLESSARILMEAGRVPEGIDLLRRLLSLQPNRCDLWQLRAEAFLDLDDEESAYESYRACLKIEPNHLDSLFTLGGMLASRHPEETASLREAIELWDRFLKLGQADSRFSMVQKALPRIKQRLNK